MVAQLDPHQPHAPGRGFVCDCEPAVEKPDHEHQKRKEEQRGEGGEGHGDHAKDANQYHVNAPSGSAFQQHAFIELGLGGGVGQAKGDCHCQGFLAEYGGLGRPRQGPPRGERVKRARSLRRPWTLAHPLRGHP